MNTCSRTFFLFFCGSAFLFVGCARQDPMLSLLGKKESELIAAWGEPLRFEGQDFEFYQPYTGPKYLFYEREGKQLFVAIKGKVVYGFNWIPPIENE